MTSFQPVASGGAAQPGDVERARAVLNAATTELADLRAAATKWQAALASLVGGITVFTLVKGRQDVVGLRSPWNVVFGVLLAAALACALVGALLAMVAAYGLPVEVSTASWQPLVRRHSDARRARRLLTLAVVTTASSVVLLGTAAGVGWYAPQRLQPVLSVILRSGEGLCGDVERFSNGELVLKTASGTATIAITDIVGARPLSTCPSG